MNFIVFDNITWRGLTYIRAKFIPFILTHIDQYMMNHILSHSHQFFQYELSGKIAKQIGNLIDDIEKLISSVGANFLRGASLLFTAFIASYFVNPIFCFILVA